MACSSWEDNEEVAGPSYYCLVETKAPGSFELQSRPIFRIPWSTPPMPASTPQDHRQDVAEGSSEAPAMTGAAGVGVLIALGASRGGLRRDRARQLKRRKRPTPDRDSTRGCGRRPPRASTTSRLPLGRGPNDTAGMPARMEDA